MTLSAVECRPSTQKISWSIPKIRYKFFECLVLICVFAPHSWLGHPSFSISTFLSASPFLFSATFWLFIRPTLIVPTQFLCFIVVIRISNLFFLFIFVLLDVGVSGARCACRGSLLSGGLVHLLPSTIFFIWLILCVYFSSAFRCNYLWVRSRGTWSDASRATKQRDRYVFMDRLRWMVSKESCVWWQRARGECLSICLVFMFTYVSSGGRSLSVHGIRTLTWMMHNNNGRVWKARKTFHH